MALYLQPDLNGSGSLGEELNGLHVFTITNLGNAQGNYSAYYLVLEGNATANQNLVQDQSVRGVFSFLNGVKEENIIMGEYGWSITLPPSPTVSFAFQTMPLQVIPANSYYIKGVGNFDLNIS